MSGDGPNEILARTRRGDRGGAIVGIGTGADQRRIADPTPALRGQSAGRGRSRAMAIDIDGDRSDGSVLHFVIEPRPREQFVELASPLRSFEPVVRDLLQ